MEEGEEDSWGDFEEIPPDVKARATSQLLSGTSGTSGRTKSAGKVFLVLLSLSIPRAVELFSSTYSRKFLSVTH